MMLFVDRIEGELVVCETEDGEFMTISLADLPDGVREGSVLERDENSSWFLNTEEEEKRRNELFQLQEELFEK